VAVAVYSGEEAVIIRGKGRIIYRDEEFVKRTQDPINKLRLDKHGGNPLGVRRSQT